MKRNPGQLVLLFILYMGLALWMNQLFFRPTEPPKPPTAQEIAQVRQEAERLLQQARTSGAERTLREREQLYHQAVSHYDRIVRVNSKSDAAIDARLAKAAVFEEMARFSPGYVDNAATEYKNLKNDFGHRRATLTLDGKPQQVDAFEVANARLEKVLRIRAEQTRTRFLYKVMDVLVAMTGRIPSFSYWFALLMLVVIVKGLLYPFTKRQYKSMHDMQRVAPLIKEAQEKLKGRPSQEIHQRIMAIYRENNVSMTAGCLPALVQMAALFPLYYMVLYYEYEFRNGRFLWIGSDLSQQYPQYLATSLAAFDLPLFVLYLVSFLATSLLAPPPADPQQAQQQKIMMFMMPVMFGFMMFYSKWPAAFTFYWLVLNVVSAAQQYYILKQHPTVPAVRPEAVGGSRPGPVGRNGRDGRNQASQKPASRPRRKARR